MTRKILLIALIGMTLFACKSRNQMVYMRNLGNQQYFRSNADSIKTYRVQENDNLYIDIQTMNPEINALFNPTKAIGATGGTSQNYGLISSQYLNGFQVDKDGTVSVPILGKVKVVGNSVKEIQNKLQAAADEYLKDPIVKVKLLSFKVSILGEVKTPGVYHNYHDNLTIIEALAQANGETDFGSIKNILVIRTIDGMTSSYRLDLTNKDFLNSEGFHLQPNDIVYVEPDKSKALQINLPIYGLIMSSISTLVLLLTFVQN